MKVAEHRRDEIVTTIRYLQSVAYQNSAEKGWWDSLDYNTGEKIALMHSELSEALEAFRHGNPPDHHCPEFSNGVIEFADTVIRILDLCERAGYPLAEALLAKMDFNDTREPLHGGKKF